MNLMFPFSEENGVTTKNNIWWRSYDISVHIRSLPLVPVVPTRHINTSLYKIVVNITGFQTTVYLNGVSYTCDYTQNECEYDIEYSVVL